MSADPLTVHTLGGDLNLYAYVSGRALKATDPLGLDEDAPQDASGWADASEAMGVYTPPRARSAPAPNTGGYGGAPGQPDGEQGTGGSFGTSPPKSGYSIKELDNIILEYGPKDASETAELAATLVLEGEAMVVAPAARTGRAALSLIAGGLLVGARTPEEALIGGMLFGATSGSAGSLERASGGAAYAKRVLPGGTGRALAGHAEYRFGSGDASIPEGTTLTTWTSHGRGIPDKMGQLIEAGEYERIALEFADRAEGAASWLPGAEIPNYTLKAPSRLTIMQHSMTVESATPLSDLLKPGMGHLDWAACQSNRF